MERQTENKLVMIVRRTRLDELIARFNTGDQARFYIEHLGADFSDYQQEDRLYKRAVRQAEDILSRLGRLQIVNRAFLPNFLFGPRDTVVALGQDGLVADVLKTDNRWWASIPTRTAGRASSCHSRRRNLNPLSPRSFPGSARSAR